MNRCRVDDPALTRSVRPGPTWRPMSANESRTSVRLHSIYGSFASWRTRPGPVLGSRRPRSCWLTHLLEMLELTNATHEPRNENVPQASTHSCTQMLISTTRRSRLDVLPPSTGLRRGPTARHRRTTDRSSATADGSSDLPNRRFRANLAARQHSAESHGRSRNPRRSAAQLSRHVISSPSRR